MILLFVSQIINPKIQATVVTSERTSAQIILREVSCEDVRLSNLRNLRIV